MVQPTFQSFVIAILLSGLFAIAMINASLFLAMANNSDKSLANDPALRSYSIALNDTLEEAHKDANASQDAITKSPISISGSFRLIDAIGGIWTTLIAVPIAIYNLTFGLIKGRILGGESFAVVFSILGAIMIIIIILAFYKMYVSGE